MNNYAAPPRCHWGFRDQCHSNTQSEFEGGYSDEWRRYLDILTVTKVCPQGLGAEGRESHTEMGTLEPDFKEETCLCQIR